jgi:hypothetical protein
VTTQDESSDRTLYPLASEALEKKARDAVDEDGPYE